MKISNNQNDPQISWLAGLIEGEGSFNISNGKYCYISVSMTDEDVISRLHFWFGGNINGPYKSPSRVKLIWTWRLSNSPDVLCLLKMVRPWMLSRRSEKIDEMIRILEQRKIPVHDETCNGDHTLSERFSYKRTVESNQKMSEIKKKINVED